MLHFEFKIKTLLDKLNNVFITIQNYITIKIINLLGPKFKTYITILNKKAWNKKKLPDLDLLLKNLKKKEIYIVKKTLLNLKKEEICMVRKTLLNNF